MAEKGIASHDVGQPISIIRRARVFEMTKPGSATAAW